MKTKLFILLILLLGIFTTCENDPCKEVNCSNGGTCVDGDCICKVGYSGSNCEYYTDLCANINCQNGGECIEGNCDCLTGFAGENCQNELAPPGTFRVQQLILYNFPEFDPEGNCWDQGDCFPDIRLSFTNNGGSALYSGVQLDCRVSEGPYELPLTNTSILNRTTLYDIYVIDEDDSGFDIMMNVNLNLSLIYDSAPYPYTLNLGTDNFTIQLVGNWQF